METQKQRFDIVIHNINNNKYILIENSFYNTGGLKINEAAKSYTDLNNNIQIKSIQTDNAIMLRYQFYSFKNDFRKFCIETK